MRNKQTTFILIIALSSILVASNFYLNLYNEGKKLYLSGNYEEAAENFRIAEFGLMEKPEVLKDLYLYYALAHFQLKQGEKVMEITGKLKTRMNLTSFNDLRFPDPISEDLDLMFSTIDKEYKNRALPPTDQKGPETAGKSAEDHGEYDTVYSDVRASMKGMDLAPLKIGLKKLKKLNKNDIRTRLMEGILYFRENNYKKAINELILVNKTGNDLIKGEAAYYLSLSHYFLKNYGQFLAFSQQVKDTDSISKLNELKTKVDSIRKEGINSVKNNFFSKKIFINFVEQFVGDLDLAGDLLAAVETNVPLRVQDVYQMADATFDYPQVYGKEFVLALVSYFGKREEEGLAEKVVKRSRFYKENTLDNAEVLYQLGILFDQAGNKRKMRKIMIRVKQIDPGYKNVDGYLTK